MENVRTKSKGIPKGICIQSFTITCKNHMYGIACYWVAINQNDVLLFICVF